jgi:bacterioferritin
MSEIAQKISKVDREELLKVLNIAYAEEWLAYYQYWLGAQLIVGPERKSIAEEFIEHANEEFDHAQKLATRIIELGGTPILYPEDWQKVALCKYDAPEKPYVMNLLEQNLVAERCAVVRYQKICEMTHGNDYETYHMAVKILHEELEHEEEILSFKNDINALFEYKNEMQA